MSTPSPPRRPRHLMDPNNLQRSQSSDVSLTRVQRWVMSALAVTTIMHLSGGVVLAAAYVEESRTDAQVGLLVIAAIFGLLAVASGFLIHHRSAFTPWILLGLLPALAGVWWVF